MSNGFGVRARALLLLFILRLHCFQQRVCESECACVVVCVVRVCVVSVLKCFPFFLLCQIGLFKLNILCCAAFNSCCFRQTSFHQTLPNCSELPAEYSQTSYPVSFNILLLLGTLLLLFLAPRMQQQCAVNNPKACAATSSAT